MSQAQASLQRVIEAAPLAIALLDARRCAWCRSTRSRRSVVGATPERLIGRAPEEVFGARGRGRAARATWCSALALARGDDRASTASSATASCRSGTRATCRSRPAPGEPPDQLLLVATDVTEQRAAQEARLEAAIAQREMLVKEVHHRIKNNLQGVAGLLQQIAKRKPEVAGAIDEVVGQVQAIAQVYGLQVGDSGPLRLARVVEAITGSVQRTFGRRIRLAASAAPARPTGRCPRPRRSRSR